MQTITPLCLQLLPDFRLLKPEPYFRNLRILIKMDRLKQYGKKWKTCSDILNRLMDAVGYETFMERQYKKLEEKETFVSMDEI